MYRSDGDGLMMRAAMRVGGGRGRKRNYLRRYY